MIEFDRLSKIQEKFLERRIICIYGFIDEEMTDYVSACIARLRSEDSPDVEIYITSRGGNTFFGLCLYDLFRLYTGKKTAIVIGSANSMAAVVLQSCDIRKCAKQAEIHIHKMLTPPDFISLAIVEDGEKFNELLNVFRNQQEAMIDIFRQRTGLTKDEIIALLKKDLPMNSSEALAFGFIDEII